MTPEYDIVIPGDIDAATRASIAADMVRAVDRKAERNGRILSWFAKDRIPDVFADGVAEARAHLGDVMREAGIPFSDFSVADPVFVDKHASYFLEGAMRMAGSGGGYLGSAGVYDFFDDRPVVILEKSDTLTYTVSVAFHEMYHAAARQIVVPMRGKPMAIRGGFWLDGPKDDPLSWFLEEGFVESEAARFRARIAGKPPYAADTAAFRELLAEYDAAGNVQYGKVRFGDDTWVAAEYCSVVRGGWFGLGTEMHHSGLSSFAPEAIDIMLAGFRGKRDDMMSLMRRARMDVRLVGEVARAIDAVWGKGTYRSMLTCRYDNWDAYDVLENFREKAKTMGLPS